MDLALEAHPQRAATRGLASRDDPAHPFQAQGQTLFNGDGGFHTITAMAIPDAQAQRDASSAAPPKTEQHLFAIVPPVFALPIGRPRRSWGLRFVLIDTLEGNRGGVLV